MNRIPQALINQLMHTDSHQRKDAVMALSQLDHPEKVTILIDALRTETDPFIREDMTYALARMGELSMPHLVQLLQDERPQVRDQAAHVLGKIGDASAVDALIDALEDENPAVVAKAAFALHQIGDTRAIQALVAQLGQPSDEVQTMLTDIIPRFGSSAIDVLNTALESDRWDVREQVIEILGSIPDERARSIIITALQDSDWRVRFMAISVLGQTQDAAVSNALAQLTDDPDTRVRKLVHHLLNP